MRHLVRCSTCSSYTKLVVLIRQYINILAFSLISFHFGFRWQFWVVRVPLCTGSFALLWHWWGLYCFFLSSVWPHLRYPSLLSWLVSLSLGWLLLPWQRRYSLLVSYYLASTSRHPKFNIWERYRWKLVQFPLPSVWLLISIVDLSIV